MLRKNPYKIPILISLLLHVVAFLSYRSLQSVHLFYPISKPKTIEEEEKRLEFEIVETPENARSAEKPDKANLLSDKNSIARDPYKRKDKDIGTPFSRGETDIKTIDQPPSQTRAAEAPLYQPTQPDEDEQGKIIKRKEDFAQKFSRSFASRAPMGQKFNREFLLGQSNAQTLQQKRTLPRPRYDNREFNARDLGGFTFNTYAWDFAPYLLAMKRRVESNIFPPPAFTHMGLISGETVLRFKVMPGGEIRDLEVLNHKGHDSLRLTSINAIKISAPFKPLPNDFPEDYLEVTAKFQYVIRR